MPRVGAKGAEGAQGGTGGTTATGSQSEGLSNTSIESHGIREVEGTHSTDSTDGAWSHGSFSGLTNPPDTPPDAAIWAFDSNNMALKRASVTIEPTVTSTSQIAIASTPTAMGLESPTMSFEPLGMSTDAADPVFDFNHFIAEEDYWCDDPEGKFDDLWEFDNLV